MQRRIGILVYIKSFFLRYRAIFFIVGLAVASIVGVIHLFNISNNHNVELIGLSSIKESSKAFTDLERNVNHTLSVALEVLAPNDKIAELFAKREREALLHECEPLFFHLKKQNRITHWYFINPAPEKTCFLRVHNPTLHDDVITRVTLENCIKTGKYSFGKEMGKTALALRAVRPYYYKGRLLGYMELAVQVEDFLEMLKEQSGNEYCLLLKKKLVDKARWKSIIKDKNIPDNWDDMDYLLLIYSTWQCIYFNKYNNILMDMKDIPDEELVLEKIDRDDNNYIRGMFPFYDASGRKTGIILSLKEITPIIGAMEGQKKEVVLMILGFMGLITFFMIFFHKRAEKELRKYRNQLEDMVQDSTAELREINMRLNREIKEHKAAQKALEEECKARQEAEEKNVQAVKHAERSARLASIGVMAASITHEINQPLNAIKVTADSIQYWHKRNPGALPDPFVDQLNIITQSVRRIVEIVQHMRTFWVIPDAPKISELDINQAVKNALTFKKKYPSSRVDILYRDMRCYGLGELNYRRARTAGINFIRFDTENNIPSIDISDNDISVTVTDPSIRLPIHLKPQFLILSTGIKARDTEDLASMLRIPRTSDGFFIEAHAKLRPVDLPSEGLFMAGTAHAPKDAGETISQAQAAVARATTILAQSKLQMSGVISSVNPDNCAVCLTCVRACPYGVPFINDNHTAEINPALCQGCGICVAECPAKTISLGRYEDKNISAKLGVYSERKAPETKGAE